MVNPSQGIGDWGLKGRRSASTRPEATRVNFIVFCRVLSCSRDALGGAVGRQIALGDAVGRIQGQPGQPKNLEKHWKNG